MRKQLVSFLPCLAILGALFYGLPGIALSLPDGHFLMMIALLLVFPAACFFVCMFHGNKHGFSWIAPLISGLLFFPCVFLFYNLTAWVYVIAYIVLAYIGEAVGYVMWRSRIAR